MEPLLFRDGLQVKSRLGHVHQKPGQEIEGIELTQRPVSYPFWRVPYGPLAARRSTARGGAGVGHCVCLEVPSSRMTFSGSMLYTQGAEFFQPFFIRLPSKTLSGSCTRSPSTPSTML